MTGKLCYLHLHSRSETLYLAQLRQPRVRHFFEIKVTESKFSNYIILSIPVHRFSLSRPSGNSTWTHTFCLALTDTFQRDKDTIFQFPYGELGRFFSWPTRAFVSATALRKMAVNLWCLICFHFSCRFAWAPQ